MKSVSYQETSPPKEGVGSREPTPNIESGYIVYVDNSIEPIWDLFKNREGDGEMGRWGDGEMGRWGDESIFLPAREATRFAIGRRRV
ncbi:hypothetical protein [Okeania sp. KiyG1]|uniref:hypothetical protein n=1 Tax=Okeania sp. KiyG1 TaxID=2720165 RepID=UPI0019204F39|nr:hypothetical protein [Okeania sp. KiyG1]